MAVTDLAPARPEWTEINEKNGLDPLGLQSGSIALYQSLIPGISNVTLRIRYYGFYAWLCRAYASRVGDTDPEIWKRYIRRAEALYALIAAHRGDEYGVAGSIWANKKHAKGSDPIEFAADAEPGSKTYYLKQAWGAYGAAYASQLYEIGIFADADEHSLPVPGKEVGEAAADAFENSAGPLADHLFRVIERGKVTRRQLAKFVSLSPSGVKGQAKERAFFRKLLFGEHLNRPADRQRRLSLQVVLAAAGLLGGSTSDYEVRWALYAGRDSTGSELELPTQILREHVGRWRAYQANDLCHVALETLLRWLLDRLEGKGRGVQVDELIALAANELAHSVVEWPKSWAGFVAGFVVPENANNPTAVSAERTLAEEALKARDFSRLCRPQTAWAALQLLGILYRRVRAERDEILRYMPNGGSPYVRNVVTELLFLEHHESLDFKELLHRLFDERVLQRHLWVAMNKLRFQKDYTFLVERDEGRVRLRALDGPMFTNPRLRTSLGFLRDLRLINDAGLTADGRAALAFR